MPLMLGTLVSSTLGSSGARAQQALADDYASVPLQPGSLFTVWSGQTFAPGAYAVALGGDVRSLELPALAGGATRPARSSVSSFGVLGSLGVWRRFDLSAGITVERVTFEPPTENGLAPPDGAMSGVPPDQTWLDVRVVPRLRVWGDTAGNALAVLLPIWRPQGAPAAYADPGLRLEPRVALNLGAGALSTTLNAGYVLHGADLTPGAEDDDFANLGVGAELELSEGWSILGELGTRWSPPRRAVEDSGFASEVRLGGRYASGGWGLQVGGGTGVTGAASEPTWRMLANVSFGSDAFDEPAALEAPPPTAESPETTSYPNEGSDWRAPEATDPTAAAPGAVVTGPIAPEPHASVPPAPDADAAPDASVPGSTQPSDLPTIDLVLYFAPDRISLDRKQVTQLRQVAEQLRSAGPDIHLIVDGHTDSTGTRAWNWKLSRLRASVARYHLTRMGIPWQRIGLKAYGESRSAAAGKPGASAPNRRVEFRLVHSSRKQKLRRR